MGLFGPLYGVSGVVLSIGGVVRSAEWGFACVFALLLAVVLSLLLVVVLATTVGVLATVFATIVPVFLLMAEYSHNISVTQIFGQANSWLKSSMASLIEDETTEK